jgi:hypothetical protein
MARSSIYSLDGGGDDVRGGKDAALLAELRERYRYASDMFREAREERRVDMRYICGDPWKEEDRKARDDAGRPCINHDELGQYVNACVNNARQNKRGIKVDPAGNGASDKTAELRENLTRRIEYRSHAQQLYLTAFQAMVEGSYGSFRIGRRYLPGSFNQEIVVKPIANPDAVLHDPDCKEPDWSDQAFCFVLDPLPREEFKRRWPKAKVQDFSNEEMRIASDWIQDKTVLVAEYWKVETDEATLYELASGEVVEELPEGQQAARTRIEERKRVMQYMTNGIEILERTEQPGELIPIIPVIGLQRYVDDGSGPKRKLFSLVRLARDPQMSLAYLNSQQMEEAGLTPKTPYLGYKGQFETDAEAWETVTKVPHAYLQVDPIVDAATGQVLPLPQRVPFTPNFAAYEVAKDSTRRAVQAAMGISPLPTAAQRNNEKSGVALEKITQQQDMGSFHFIDGYDRALEYAGRVIDSWIDVTYDTEREEALRKPDDSQQVVRLNTPAPYPDPKTNEPQHYPVGEGDHDITISTGPSSDSQRDAAAEFLDTIVANLGTLPIPPQQQAKLLAIAVRMRNLGPRGDQMADIISPQDDQQMPAAAQAKLQQASQMIQQLTGAVHQLSQKLEAKLPELETRRWIALVQAKAGVIGAALKAKSGEAIAAFDADLAQIDRMLALVPDPAAGQDADLQQSQQQHEAGMQASQQAHERGMAAATATSPGGASPEASSAQPLPQAA